MLIPFEELKDEEEEFYDIINEEEEKFYDVIETKQVIGSSTDVSRILKKAGLNTAQIHELNQILIQTESAMKGRYLTYSLLGAKLKADKDELIIVMSKRFYGFSPEIQELFKGTRVNLEITYRKAPANNINIFDIYYDGKNIYSNESFNVDKPMVKLNKITLWQDDIIDLVVLKIRVPTADIDYLDLFNKFVSTSKNLLSDAYAWNSATEDDKSYPLFYKEMNELLFIQYDKLIGYTKLVDQESDLLEDRVVNLDLEYKPDEKRSEICADDSLGTVKDFKGITILAGNNSHCLHLRDLLKIFSSPDDPIRDNQMIYDTYVFYECKRDKEPIDSEPYFLLEVSPEDRYLIPLKDIRKVIRYHYQSGVKLFKLEKAVDNKGKQIELKYTMSHGIAIKFVQRLNRLRREGDTRDLDSCQPGSDKLLYRLYPVTSQLNRRINPARARDTVEYKNNITTRNMY